MLLKSEFWITIVDLDIGVIKILFPYGREGRYLPIIRMPEDKIPEDVPGYYDLFSQICNWGCSLFYVNDYKSDCKLEFQMWNLLTLFVMYKVVIRVIHVFIFVVSYYGLQMLGCLWKRQAGERGRGKGRKGGNGGRGDKGGSL